MTSQKRKNNFSEQDLERRILHGLVCEWEEALWVLSSSHRKSMRAPLFSIREMKNRWGYWSGKNREISLSRKLVFDHSWDAVREVLLHEIAHQFAEEVLKGRNDPPHGPQFQRACYLLRANPKASGNYTPLDERMSHESSSVEDKTMLRVKKLMALAKSQNKHEAEAAMTKAHELIARNNINLLAKDEKRDFTSVFVGKPALRHPREEYHLAHLLQDFYFVTGIWVSAYVVEKEKMGRVLEIIGTEKNIKLASYIYDFVRNFIDLQWAEYNKGKGLNRHRKTDFAIGIIEGFRSKLNSRPIRKDRPQEKYALIKIEDPLLEKYFSYKYPRTTAIRKGVSMHDTVVLNDGKSVGKKLVIYKGITEKGKKERLFIGN
jgi:hypothetical protein